MTQNDHDQLCPKSQFTAIELTIDYIGSAEWVSEGVISDTAMYYII